MWFWHGMGLWGWLGMIAFWAVGFLLIIWAVPTTSRQREEDSALRTLDVRLARGEIDRGDYEERRRVLEGHR